MKIEVSIDESCEETKISIITNKITPDIMEILSLISEYDEEVFTAYSDRGIEFIKHKEIIRIFTENKRVLIQTKEGKFNMKLRLYEIEERLDEKNFVRISNSEIININKILYMDAKITGTIAIHLKEGITTYSSRRYVTKIKKIFDV